MDGIDRNPRQQLSLLLVAGRHHLSSRDLRELVEFLQNEDCGFDVSLQISDPSQQPELLELHRLVVTPSLVKLQPQPKQVFAGSSIFQQLRGWLPRWQQDEVVSGLGLSLKPTELDGSRTQRELQLEDQLLVLRQENETLIDRLQAQERLLRMVAHEVRTPLTAATLAVQSQELGQIDIHRFRDVLKRRLEEIALLSMDLLEVGSTRWEALFNPQRLDLASVAAEAILELEKLWLGRDVTIHTDIPADLPKVFADQRRMRQVLLNLLENALKYTPNGGLISLTMLHRTSQWVQVSICDSGPGIPEEEQQRIFLDRVRLPQTSAGASGFGVGLSVCRRIVEVHGGRIWVISEPDKGACFTFNVPVWQGQGQEKENVVLTEGQAEP
ncbi:MAG: histidine kinase [Synechococcus sp.]|uniref:histidine kinase n=1 Tax=Synechococcus sp. MVIR-18-1 TaxID=1386941 RepID=UPI0016471157|nr:MULTISPECIES: histidine kinase [unclassified Synechococcus]MCH9772024.1 histidine kinase [Cyanobacteriota bacterium]MDA7491208.1 histidine kinase [Synechococcus sp. AH-707-M23]MDC0251262.1 histidine kinase [Synechococcus sp. AH-551-P21]MDC0325936.1 histidine kinase [bacterium]MDG1060183.1 histidine kinase [Synechococcus sp. cluster3_bin.96]MDG2215328.1 histidine kinase [Synechococcus sp. cluster2_bin.235]NCG16542.1 histidine kinase [Synechococcales cyanobacterium H12SWP_bin.12]